LKRLESAILEKELSMPI